MLHPYIGTLQKYRFASPGKGASHRLTSGDDGSKTITYSFNSLGFRGEEFDPYSPVKLFVCGCSMTFGTGLELEETWAFLFKQRLAEQRDLPATSVNLMNFAEGGASNDYITRTLIEQSARVRPDVIVAGFTHMNRFELLDETATRRFGPWAIEEAADRFGEIGKCAEFLFLGTDEIQQKIRMIKNVLLLQYFCQSRDIPFVFIFFESLQRADLPSALSVPTTQPLFEEIDLELLVPIDRAVKVDRALDGTHPGPRSQELIADAAWETFSARYAQPLQASPRQLMEEETR
jgi:hypothetical protein